MPKATKEQTANRAAAALDATHRVGERGPKTFQARQRIAAALDAGRRPLVKDIRWLEQVAQKKANPARSRKETETVLTLTARRRADVPRLRDRARKLARSWSLPVVIASPKGYAYEIHRPDKRNPAHSAAQYGAAQAVLSGSSTIMPPAVARELVDATPPATRRKFARELAASRRRTNPEDEETEQAAQLWRKFHGADPDTVTTVKETRQEPSTLTALGDLSEFKVRVRPGEIATLRFPGDAKLTSTPDGRQLYIVGGDQSINLRKLGISAALAKDHVLIGELLAVTYDAKKEFDGFRPVLYVHKFGERGKERPVLAYDNRSHRLYVVGGAYRVRPEGIID